MSQNNETHFKNLAANAARFLSVFDHFGTLCIKGLNLIKLWSQIQGHVYCGQFSFAENKEKSFYD